MTHKSETYKASKTPHSANEMTEPYMTFTETIANSILSYRFQKTSSLNASRKFHTARSGDSTNVFLKRLRRQRTYDNSEQT